MPTIICDQLLSQYSYFKNQEKQGKLLDLQVKKVEGFAILE